MMGYQSERIGKDKGWGGTHKPCTYLDTGDEVGIGTLFQVESAPIGIPSTGTVGGTFAHIRNFPAGGIETQYDLFDLDMNTGSLFIRADVTNNSLTIDRQGVQPTLGIN